MIGKAHIFASLLVVFSLFVLNQSTLAQNESFQAVVSKTTVNEGERFRLEYNFNGSGDEFRPPRFEGFRILSGPNQSSSMQFVNGRSSYSISFSYVLMALKEGEYTIPSATISSGSNTITSNELNINVVKGKQSPQSNNQQSPSGNNAPPTQSKTSKEADDNLFIRAYVSNSTPYVGEQLIATYKLYFNFNIVDNSFTTLPSLNGFWSEELEVKANARETEVVNGVRYNVAILKSSILIPQRADELVLDPLEMDLVVQQPVQSRSRSLFDQFFGNYKNVKISVKSAPVKVKVLQLPAGKPANFDGAVGDYSIKLVADRQELKSNEAINLTYEVSGKGNLKLLKEPSIDFPSDFEVYDPKVRDNISSTTAGLNGSRSYNYLVIPRFKGEYDISPLTFTYFNPKKEKYITLSTNALNFKIEKGEDEATSSVTYSGQNKEEIKLLGSDIRFIKNKTLLSPIGYNFFGSFLFYFLWLLPLPLFLIVLKLKQRVSALRNDDVYMKRSKAKRMAEKRLSSAKKLMSSGDDKPFYEEVFKAMYGFIKDKFNIAQAEINKEKIRQVFKNNGIDEALINRTEDLLNKCEMARFSPISDVSHEEIYNEAELLLSSIQKQLK